MKAVAGCLVVFILLESAYTDMGGECEMANFYKELGCTAQADGGDSSAKSEGVKCPHVFTCPELYPEPDKCYYRGVSYSDKQPLPQARIREPCSQACTCRILNGAPEFECAAVDCVEFFDGNANECVKTYDLEHCCSVGKVCGKDPIAKLQTCVVDGKNYREGEFFTPKNTAKNCICTEKWNGSIENTDYCKDLTCGLEIHYQDKLFRKCAPMFFTEPPLGGQCPIGFRCPHADMKLRKGTNVRGVSAACSFGNETLTVGDSVDFPDCIRCHCTVPPFLSCSKQAPSKCQPEDTSGKYYN